MDKFTRTKSMDVQLRKLLLNMSKQIQIPLLGQFRMVTSLHQNLRSAERNGLLDLLIDFIEGDHISITIFLGPIKGAKLAINVANVGVIDIAIDNVSDNFLSAAAVS